MDCRTEKYVDDGFFEISSIEVILEGRGYGEARE
jgi:hypothetical protein